MKIQQEQVYFKFLNYQSVTLGRYYS